MKKHANIAVLATLVGLLFLGGCAAGIRNTEGMRLNAPRHNPNVEIQPIVINSTPEPIFVKIREDNHDSWQVDPGCVHSRRMKTHEVLHYEIFAYREGFANKIGESKVELDLIKTGLYTGKPIEVTDMMFHNRTLQEGYVRNTDAYPMRIIVNGRDFGWIAGYQRTPLFYVADGNIKIIVESQYQPGRSYRKSYTLYHLVDKIKGDNWVDLGNGYPEAVDWYYDVTIQR